MRRAFLPSTLSLWFSFIVFHQREKSYPHSHRHTNPFKSLRVFKTTLIQRSCTHTHTHRCTRIYLCLHMHANSQRLPCPLCTRACRHKQKFFLPYFSVCHLVSVCFFVFVLFVFFLGGGCLFVCFFGRVPCFAIPWCHSETTRAAQKQINPNCACCTCGLSSSQSLGKYPINNPGTSTPVTPSHPHTTNQCI